MADIKVSALTAVTNAVLDDLDLILVADTSAVESKSILVSEVDKRYSKARQVLPVAFTPNITGVGAVFQDEAGFYRDNGNYRTYEISFGVTSGGSSGNLTFTLPASNTIDTTYIMQTGATTIADNLGFGKWFDSGSAYRTLMPIYVSTTTLYFAYGSGAALTTSAVLAAGDKFSITVIVPLLELVANVDAT